MISARTFTIVGIIVLFAACGIFLYTEYSNRTFEATLPNPPQVFVSEPDETPAPVETFKENTPMEPHHATDTQVTATKEIDMVPETTETEPELEGFETALENDPVFAPENPYEMSPEEMDQAFATALSYEFTDINETYGLLEEALTTKFGDSEHIPPFLNAWKASYFILEEVKEISENGGNIDHLLAQVPAVVTSQLIETTIQLTNISESEAAEGRAIVANLTDTIDTMEIVNETKPLVEDAIISGDITPEEAADFFKALGNVDVKIVYQE